jgi:type II secretory pathway pseudopilin PulG
VKNKKRYSKLKKPQTQHQKKKEKKYGAFTIIEVVLVLAIAGLIFLMVFIALPALQRSQRNTQRKEDMGRIASQINLWLTRNKTFLDDSVHCNNSSARNCFQRFADTYMEPSESYSDPSTGLKYVVALWDATSVNGEDRDPDILGQLDANGNAIGQWPEIKVGEFQYDTNGFCTENGEFSDGPPGFATQGRYFAIRYALEGGGHGCIDNGYDTQ